MPKKIKPKGEGRKARSPVRSEGPMGVLWGEHPMLEGLMRPNVATSIQLP